MTIDECYQLGYVIKAHGYKGEIMILLDVDNPEDYEELESVFVEINQQLVPFFVEHIQVLAEKRGVAQAIVKFEDVDTGEKATELKSCSLYLPLDNLPELEDNPEGRTQFYFHEIINFTVVDKQLGTLGIVSNVYNFDYQDVIAMTYKEKEVLIPMNDEILLGIDRQARQLDVNLPDGLLEVYLEE
jgi:16S rRNA processing protein RimM